MRHNTSLAKAMNTITKLAALLIAAFAAATLIAACDTTPPAAQPIPHTTTAVQGPSLDDLYLQVLHNNGVNTNTYPLATDQAAITIGRDTICPELRASGNWQAIGLALISEGLTPTNAGTVIGAANAAYCPDIHIDWHEQGVR